jgi:hypothetical protein
LIPLSDEEQRVIRIAIADEVITSAATAVGLELEELGNYLPGTFLIQMIIDC